MPQSYPLLLVREMLGVYFVTFEHCSNQTSCVIDTVDVRGVCPSCR